MHRPSSYISWPLYRKFSRKFRKRYRIELNIRIAEPDPGFRILNSTVKHTHNWRLARILFACREMVSTLHIFPAQRTSETGTSLCSNFLMIFLTFLSTPKELKIYCQTTKGHLRQTTYPYRPSVFSLSSKPVAAAPEYTRSARRSRVFFRPSIRAAVPARAFSVCTILLARLS